MKPWPHSQRPKGSPVFCFANRCALPIDHKYDAPCARRRLIYATRLQPLLYCERTGSSTSTSPSSARWRFTPASGSSLKFTVSTRTSMDPVPHPRSDAQPWNAIHSTARLCPGSRVLISSSRMRSCQYNNHRKRKPFLSACISYQRGHLHTQPTLVR